MALAPTLISGTKLNLIWSLSSTSPVICHMGNCTSDETLYRLPERRTWPQLGGGGHPQEWNLRFSCRLLPDQLREISGGHEAYKYGHCNDKKRLYNVFSKNGFLNKYCTCVLEVTIHLHAYGCKSVYSLSHIIYNIMHLFTRDCCQFWMLTCPSMTQVPL